MRNYRRVDFSQRLSRGHHRKKREKSKNFIDFQKFYRLSTFHACARRLGAHENPEFMQLRVSFFDVVGRQMSFFTIFMGFAATWHGLAGENIPAAGVFYSE